MPILKCLIKITALNSGYIHSSDWGASYTQLGLNKSGSFPIALRLKTDQICENYGIAKCPAIMGWLSDQMNHESDWQAMFVDHGVIS